LRKISFAAKGSAEEQDWLNDWAKLGWNLRHVSGYVYSFKQQSFPVFIATRYLTTLPERTTDDNIIQDVALKTPQLFVQYAAVAKRAYASSKTAADDIVSGKIIAAARQRLLKAELLWALLGFLAIFSRMVYLNVSGFTAPSGMGILGSLMSSVPFLGGLLLWLVGLAGLISINHQIGQRDRQYRLLNNDFANAALTAKYVTLTSTAAQIDLTPVADLGRWQLLSVKAGDFHYRLQTLLTDDEIEQQVTAKLPTVQRVTVTKWLGFMYIPI